MDLSSFSKRGDSLFTFAFIAYKWLFVIPFLVFTTFVIGSLITLLSLLGMPDLSSRVFGPLWARLNIAVSLVTVKVEGLHNLDPQTSYIIAANHQSLVDIYVIYGYLPTNFKWVMKKELRSVPILGVACEAMGHIIVDRSNTNAALGTINLARARIINGKSVLFFPEGTRSRSGSLMPFKKGAFRLAVELGLPILPVVIHGTNKILPSDTTDLAPGNARLEILPPIETSGMDEHDIGELSNLTRNAIQNCLDDTAWRRATAIAGLFLFLVTPLAVL